MMNIEFFEENNESPPWLFLRSLSVNIRARFYRYLKHIAEGGGMIQGVAFKKLHGYPMEEIRIKSSRSLHRLIVKVNIGDKIIVLHGFTKKEGQKTPKKELEIAYQRLLTLIS